MFDKTGRITSSVFKSSKGLSVDRQWYRNIEDVANELRMRFAKNKDKPPEDFCIISVTKSDCDEVGVVCVYKPSRNNEYHAEIHESQTQTKISQSHARALVLLSKIEIP